MEALNFPPDVMRKRVEEVLDLLSLSALRNRSIATLSGGEQQMLAIGRALINNPELVLMDEPSEGLSPLFVQHIGTMMARLKTLGHSVLLVEQNLALALSVADYVYIIASGRFVFSGTPKELAEQEEILDVHLGVSGSKSLDSLTA
jgi:branched-chain amino acid transport system ATP-binding protein